MIGLSNHAAICGLSLSIWGVAFEQSVAALLEGEK